MNRDYRVKYHKHFDNFVRTGYYPQKRNLFLWNDITDLPFPTRIQALNYLEEIKEEDSKQEKVKKINHAGQRSNLLSQPILDNRG